MSEKELYKRLEEYDKEVNKLLQENKKLKEENYNLKEDLSAIRKDYEELEEENENLKDFNNKLQATKNRLDKYDRENQIRIKKAIEYIEKIFILEDDNVTYEFDNDEIKPLLKILKGEEE